MTHILDNINPDIKSAPMYVPGKTSNEIQQAYNLKNVIKLASNENPLGPSPLVKTFLNQNIANSHLYPEDAAPLLKQALAEYTNTTPQQISLGAGSSELIHQLFLLFISAGDEVITTEHSFGLYRILCHKMAASCVLSKDIQFQQNPHAILNNITAKTKMIIIANPNNPTGSWLKSEDLQQLLQNTPPHIAIVIDEAYIEYMLSNEAYESATKYLDQYPNLIVVRTFSKMYGLAGLRIGYAISSIDIAKYINQLRNPFNVSSLAMIAAHSALIDTAHIQNSIKLNQHGRIMLRTLCNDMQLTYLPPSSNFMTIHFGTQSQTIYQKLLEQGIIVRPLTAYNMPEYLRITIGTENQMTELSLALKQLAYKNLAENIT